MKIEKLIENFLESVRIKKKEETYQCYNSHLRCFKNFLLTYKIVESEDISENLFLLYVKWCGERKICNRTINKRFGLFNQVLKFNKIYKEFDSYEKLKERNLRFEVFNTEELKKILNYVYKLPNDTKNISNKLLVFVLAFTGIRINELLNIKRENIDLVDNSILLTVTKTDVDRYVFFDEYTKSLLVEYLKIPANTEKLFFNFKKNRDYTYRACRSFFEKMKRELNIKKIHPHMFRHTFATNLVLNDAPVFLIQKLLGHASVRTTEIYVHLNNKKIKECYNSCSMYKF